MKLLFEPTEDRCLVKIIKKEEVETTKAGIITETIRKPTVECEVFAIGGGVYARETGVWMPTLLNKKDIVLCSANDGKPTGVELSIENESGKKETMYLLREGDILLRIKKAED